MRAFIAITKALADENRTRTLMALRDGELCVCEVMALLGLAPSTVSKHLTVLHRAGLVESRKEGRWIYYSLPDNSPSPVREAIEWVTDCLKDDAMVLDDAKRLKAIGKMDKEELCVRYRPGK